MIYEPENLKNKRTMYEKKAKMLVTIEFFLWAVILFVYVNIVIPYVGSTIGFLTIIIGGIAIITAFYFFIAFYVLINRGHRFRKINNAKVTLLQGDPGDGKSKLMLSIAALLSKGDPLPFTDTDETEPMTIIYQTTEDDADDTVVPRFNAAGGIGENLIFIKEDVKSLSFGDNRIAEAIEKYHAKLLILDPMSSYIGEDCSMNNANETRAEFNHLIAVAKDTGCAIVIIAHMNKMKDTNPLYRTNGSIDIAGAVRSIIAITRTPNKEAPSERYMVQVKSNLAPTGSAILFEVAEKGVNFISEMEMTAEQAFQSLAPKMGRPNEKEVKATEMILEMLKDGEMLTSECEEKLEAAGFKKSTIKKAKMKAGALSKKVGFQWYWYLPVGDNPNE